jgi:hypothetical protein
MGALEIGRDRYTTAVRSSEASAKDFTNRVSRWIPGDVLALFSAALVLFAQTETGEAVSSATSVTLLIVFLLLTPAVVILGVWADGRAFRKGDFISAALSVVAFAIWSLAIPDTGWERLSWVEDNRELVVVLAAAAGILFGLVATGAEKRLTTTEQLQD